MQVFSYLRSFVPEDFLSAITLYTSLTEVVADHVVGFVREHKCNGCLIDHGSQKQHTCLRLDKEQLDSLFYAAIASLDENTILDTWVDILQQKGISLDLYCLPFHWRLDSDFLLDIYNLSVTPYGPETSDYVPEEERNDSTHCTV